MGWGFRKAFKIGRVGRITVGKRSIGGSIGVGPFRFGVNSRGSTRTRVSLPGSGLYYEWRSRTARPTASSGRNRTMIVMFITAALIAATLLRTHRF